MEGQVFRNLLHKCKTPAACMKLLNEYQTEKKQLEKIAQEKEDIRQAASEASSEADEVVANTKVGYKSDDYRTADVFVKEKISEITIAKYFK